MVRYSTRHTDIVCVIGVLNQKVNSQTLLLRIVDLTN